MAELTHGAVGWFEIGTADPAAAQRFYGELFGWSFGGEGPYRVVTTGDDHPMHGGLFDTEGAAPNYAVFGVVVADVTQACADAERLGGKVLVPVKTTDDGLTFAHLLDPQGIHLEVWSPPA